MQYRIGCNFVIRLIKKTNKKQTNKQTKKTRALFWSNVYQSDRMEKMSMNYPLVQKLQNRDCYQVQSEGRKKLLSIYPICREKQDDFK